MTVIIGSAAWKVLRLGYYNGSGFVSLNAEPAGWKDVGFDDAAWGAVSTQDRPGYDGVPFMVRTGDGQIRGDELLLRKEFFIEADELVGADVVLEYMFDDGGELFINGASIVSQGTPYTSSTGPSLNSTTVPRSAFEVGWNTIGLYVWNQRVGSDGADPPGYTGVALSIDMAIAESGPAIGYDVYRINPPGDSIEYVATLDDAFSKAIRPVRNEPGSGQGSVNRNSSNATADILAPGNLVKVRIPEIHSDHIFSWFMEQGSFQLVATDEEGGEDITIGGRGALSYWDRAIWLSERFVIPWWDAAWGTPPVGARGHVTFEAGTYRRYTIAGGVITGYTNFTTAGFEAYFDSRQTYDWPSAGSKRFLVHIMAGETHAGWYVHPHQDGVTETLPSQTVGTSSSVLLSDISADTPGAILYHLFQEGTDPGRPTQPIPLMTIDFTATADSNGDPWATTDALAGLTAELGETYLDTIAKLLSTGVIDVEMGPDLDMHAYNAQGRDLTGTTFGAGKVRFVKGVNIADQLRRERDDNPVATFIEVVGTDNVIGRATLADAASRVARETSGTGDSADETVLEAMGLASLNARLIKSDAIGFRIATGDDDATGLYLPGPEGSDNGDFWLGDVTTLHTGTGEQDFDQEDERVFAITIAEDDGGNLEVTPEVGSVLGEAERRLYANDSARTVSFASRSQFTDTEVAEPTTDTGTDLGWFDVTDYGAVGDGTTDDTVAIQDTIDACIAAGGGTVFFPVGPTANTVYQVDGALQDTGSYNSQLEIPPCTGYESITFRGSGYGYVAIRSSWNGTISGTPSILSAGTHNATPANKVNVYFEDIWFLAPVDPKLTAIDMSNATTARFGNLRVSVNGSTTAVPTHANAVGFDAPWGLNDGQSGGSDLYVTGFYAALRPSEQFELGILYAYYCRTAIEMNGQQGTPAFLRHECSIQHVMAWNCNRGIVFAGDQRWITIGLINVEHGDPAPFATVYDIDDASNFGRGFIGWHTTDYTTGPEDNLLMNGGTGLSLFGAYAKRWKLNNVVDVPTGTDPSTNPANGFRLYAASATGKPTTRSSAGTVTTIMREGDTAGGDLSGTYPNPSVTDDSHSHTAATLPASTSTSGGTDHNHVVDEQFSGDGATTVFPLANEAVPDSVMAYVSGTRTPVTLGGSLNDEITFAVAPASASLNISVDYAAASS